MQHDGPMRARARGHQHCGLEASCRLDWAGLELCSGGVKEGFGWWGGSAARLMQLAKARTIIGVVMLPLNARRGGAKEGQTHVANPSGASICNIDEGPATSI